MKHDANYRLPAVEKCLMNAFQGLIANSCCTVCTFQHLQEVRVIFLLWDTEKLLINGIELVLAKLQKQRPSVTK